MMNGPGRQRGFSLFVAIFLITSILVIALISASTLTSRSISTAQGLHAARAYYAAKSGLDYATAQVLPAGQGCGNVGDSVTVEGITVEDISVTLDCSEATVSQGTENIAVYQLSAQASTGNLNDGSFASRRLRATVSGPAP